LEELRELPWLLRELWLRLLLPLLRPLELRLSRETVLDRLRRRLLLPRLLYVSLAESDFDDDEEHEREEECFVSSVSEEEVELLSTLAISATWRRSA
jgi:hypothetical protein